MVEIGYTMMCEQRSPGDLVRDAVHAERAGFDFAVISDHYHPWLEAQGHSPYAWSVLGAVAQATERIPLMTYVTCPTIRYHPAVVAQKAATVSLLSGGRFSLGLGAGENLNEHVVGAGWPPVDVRHEMLAEAVEIIRDLFGGGYVTYRGAHYAVEDARLFDPPEEPLEVGIAASGRESCNLAGEYGDFLIAVEPERELVQMYREAGGDGGKAVAQLPVSWGPDEAERRRIAHEQFSWLAAGWKVMAELPNPVNFEAYTQFVREDDVAELVPCGPEVEGIVEGVKRFADAGFTHVALVQIGDAQQEFCEFYRSKLGPALKEL
ncbi:LLM class F420-dependent oxidoreductase [Rubrobacter taiwanensis]|jgi:G6PDH family F420-dependent oxidoreductase|uniref:LLM class F420-dependent oxidoreductase n=1 Tax=Rubrobacter taiwanensis TaxID=185139 RepID=A0A4R1BRX1_9ACTN|nr:LLM class F420-dependent oxidoreductase [Rubrobacter taiwanensis]TCJ20539.1 LLM class F420-dependent oxidoreductase [Rubrobacter taiwanensis]